ncbi:hypothetical protein PDESU_00382 [Pontiella desulfatans]|uniref:Uncharacterized protein n=1 Tax=Pontiella desulfatans TaxID=2750659 RepID=A0A6C2TVZ0_PONDE|nr:hypothetical protein [Pontiella desulfatans]VGO11835.1 hypothetical protein PDESU_00382 [Pontiella desulfatans]
MKKLIIALVLFIIPLSILALFGAIIWFENSHWVKGNDIVYEALPETQEWLLSQRPSLEIFPSDLPHLVTKTATHRSELKDSPDVLSTTTEFKYLVLFKTSDIVLCADFSVTLTPDGNPKEIYQENVYALFTETKSNPEDGYQHMNSYFGKQLHPDKLGKYYTELSKSGDVGEIRNLINTNPIRLLSIVKDSDPILKIMSQPEH